MVATDPTGTTDGPIESFKTEPLEAPLIDGESALAVTQTDADLHALINPNFQASTYQFKLGTDTSYGLATLPATPGELGAAFGDQEVGIDLHAEGVSLEPNTVYHYEASATNESGTTEGLAAVGDESFLTLPALPTAITRSASAVATSATIAGEVNPGNSGEPQDETTYYFQYGHTTSYGVQVPLAAGAIGEGTSPVRETASLTGLEPGSTYHYRIVATNGPGGSPRVPTAKTSSSRPLRTPRSWAACRSAP